MLEVLLLEPNPEDAELIISTLKSINPDVRIEWVKSTLAALDFIFCTGAYVSRSTDQAPKLILLDEAGSQKQVVELLNILNSYARTRMLPVVVLTESTTNTAFFAEANSCIVKTSNREDFRCAIEIVGRYWLTMNKSIDRLVDTSKGKGQQEKAVPNETGTNSLERSDTVNAYR